MVSEKFKGDQDMKRNAKNQIIKVVMDEVKAGILTMNKGSQTEAIMVKKNCFLHK